ncbi:MAG: hypothetical protein COC12_07280 [Rhodobacteraceae bacterium]|nr:MAG: hypothetical protein COC12_07280 [Paracoccaceae bacterium]
MGQPQARLTDLHLCNIPVPPPAPPVPAPMPIIPPCMPTVLVGKLPAARVTDMHASAPPHPIVKGSMTVLIGKLPAARMGDLGACGGAILKGEFTVLVGG